MVELAQRELFLDLPVHHTLLARERDQARLGVLQSLTVLVRFLPEEIGRAARPGHGSVFIEVEFRQLVQHSSRELRVRRRVRQGDHVAPLYQLDVELFRELPRRFGHEPRVGPRSLIGRLRAQRWTQSRHQKVDETRFREVTVSDDLLEHVLALEQFQFRVQFLLGHAGSKLGWRTRLRRHCRVDAVVDMRDVRPDVPGTDREREQAHGHE